MNPNQNNLAQDNLITIIAEILKRLTTLETELLLLKKRVLDLENP